MGHSVVSQYKSRIVRQQPLWQSRFVQYSIHQAKLPLHFSR